MNVDTDPIDDIIAAYKKRVSKPVRFALHIPVIIVLFILAIPFVALAYTLHGFADAWKKFDE